MVLNFTHHNTEYPHQTDIPKTYNPSIHSSDTIDISGIPAVIHTPSSQRVSLTNAVPAMCKISQIRFDKCGHPHVIQTPCRGTIMMVNREGEEVVKCKGARTDSKGHLKRSDFTRHLAGKCPICPKRALLREKKTEIKRLLAVEDPDLDLGNRGLLEVKALCRETERFPKKRGFDNKAFGKSERGRRVDAIVLSRLLLKECDKVMEEDDEGDESEVEAPKKRAFDEVEVEDDPPRKKVKLTLEHTSPRQEGDVPATEEPAWERETVTRAGRRTKPSRKAREGA